MILETRNVSGAARANLNVAIDATLVNGVSTRPNNFRKLSHNNQDGRHQKGRHIAVITDFEMVA